MAAKWIKRILMLAAVASIAALFVWLMWPQPVSVDVAKVVVGHMEIAIEEEGVNRIREVYTVSTPVAGKVERSLREVGDHVIAGVTPVAAIRPVDPAMLDARTRQELVHAVEAAKADKDFATSTLLQADKELRYFETELKRARTLVDKKVMAPSAMERHQLDTDSARQRLESAKALLDVRLHNLEMAEARLLGPAKSLDPGAQKDCCVTVTAPVNGTILNVPVENEQVVQAGTPLLEIGNPLDTEIAVDLLSSDAINVKLGATARISGWGGSIELKARVTRVNPAAFTKVSALGIDEQRVKAILEIVDPPSQWTGLGHQYRILAHILTWQSDNALQIPLSAVFRKRGDWAAFKIVDGKAKLTKIETGQMNSTHVQVLNGLTEGQTVIVHPSDLIEDGVRVEIRAEAAE
jgi:HlyD family secretion protein